LKPGKVEQYLLDSLADKGHLHIALLDPIESSPENGAQQASACERSGSDAIMVGGSTVHTQHSLDEFILAVKKATKLPVIIFPNNVQSISRHADAIWFMSLLNSVDWYFIVGAQMQGALTVKSFGLEPIPMAYLVFGEDSTVAAMGRVLPLSPHRQEVAICYGLAAQFLGMRFLYLEAGSGASRPIPVSTVSAVKKNISIPLIVGGGIRTPEDAAMLTQAGADIIVTGTMLEKDPAALPAIIRGIRSR